MRLSKKVVSPADDPAHGSYLQDRTAVGSDARPQISTLFGHRASDSRSLHFSLRVDNDTGVVFEEDEDTILTPPCLALTHDDSRHNCVGREGGWEKILEKKKSWREGRGGQIGNTTGKLTTP